MPLTRIPLVASISTRDSSASKDSIAENVVFEKDVVSGRIFVQKRAGLSDAIATFPSGPGQGVFGFVNAGTPILFSISNDTLNSYSPGSGGGAGVPGGTSGSVSNGWTQL
jgi:hypothetical protein